MPFPPPKTEDSRQRFEELRTTAKDALEEIIASANETGWGTQEIVAALIEAAQSLKDAATVDPDPADDPSIPEAVREQIGHGEQFD
ncbi:hypothetical protein [Rhizobium sp. BK376]|uniref:hypothetical protein n=1 Tax=Rhizobium sp. BK376 TaxID=2512149 RepID=UPI0010457E64|nr:hypothetical protein [Rhizobium sp. BK376]TCR85465.1 hypothetical protein EV561_107237 [Rhizobium sp. BK376]